MKYVRSLATMAAMLAVSSMSLAADLSSRAAPRGAEGPPTSTNWTGPYGGGYIGVQQSRSNTSVDSFTDSQSYVIPGQTNPVQKCYSWEEQTKCYDKKHEYVTTQPYTLTTSQTYSALQSSGNLVGVTGGVYGGYNWQKDRIVVGVELDGGVSGSRDDVQVGANNASHRTPWNVNLTLRAGYLVTPNTFVFAAGGLGVKNMRSDLSGPGGAASANETKAGYTIGGGIEQNNFVLGARGRVQAMYTKVPDQTVVIPGASSTLKGGDIRVLAGLAWN